MTFSGPYKNVLADLFSSLSSEQTYWLFYYIILVASETVTPSGHSNYYSSEGGSQHRTFILFMSCLKPLLMVIT